MVRGVCRGEGCVVDCRLGRAFPMESLLAMLGIGLGIGSCVLGVAEGFRSVDLCRGRPG